MENPIGIFDSGLGGLTVYKEIRSVLPNENIIYFGDTKRAPYGEKSEEEVKQFSYEIVDFLITKNVKIIVIACNTVCAVVYDYLKEKYSVPFINIIYPAVNEAVNNAKIGIGVIGTSATIRSGAYNNAIKEKNKSIKVFSNSCPLLVPLIEEGFIEEGIIAPIAKKYLANVLTSIDTLVLGCTHYPFVLSTLKNIVGDVNIIDPAISTSLMVKQYLIENKLEKKEGTGKDTFYTSGETSKFETLYNKFTNKEIKVLGLH